MDTNFIDIFGKLYADFVYQALWTTKETVPNCCLYSLF